MSLATAWGEGYYTALRDFEIQLSDEIYEERVTKNPHTYPEGRQRLSAVEVGEIRQALGYHFNDCATAEFEDQAMIVEAIVERILSRRPARGA